MTPSPDSAAMTTPSKEEITKFLLQQAEKHYDDLLKENQEKTQEADRLQEESTETAIQHVYAVENVDDEIEAVKDLQAAGAISHKEKDDRIRALQEKKDRLVAEEKERRTKVQAAVEKAVNEVNEIRREMRRTKTKIARYSAELGLPAEEPTPEAAVA